MTALTVGDRINLRCSALLLGARAFCWLAERCNRIARRFADRAGV